MNYIDKDRFSSEFDAYSAAYLKDRYRDKVKDFFPPLNDKKTYDKFSNRKYKSTSLPVGPRFKGWLDILLKEQSCRCCYCMRSLNDRYISIEHLVPRVSTRDDYDYYAKYSSRIAEKVEHGSNFDHRKFKDAGEIDSISRFPHMIAHSNLFAACQNAEAGKEVGCSCNNHRGNRRILPLMLDPEVSRFVKYGKDGTFVLLHPDVDDVQETNNALDLNMQTLIDIRHLWYLASRKGKTPQAVNITDVKSRVMYVCELNDVRRIEELEERWIKFVDEDEAYWNLFLQYGWFYKYYSENYPNRH